MADSKWLNLIMFLSVFGIVNILLSFMFFQIDVDHWASSASKFLERTEHVEVEVFPEEDEEKGLIEPQYDSHKPPPWFNVKKKYDDYTIFNMTDIIRGFRIPRSGEYDKTLDEILSLPNETNPSIVKDQLGSIYQHYPCKPGKGFYKSYFHYFQLYRSLLGLWVMIAEQYDVEWTLFFGGQLGQHREKNLIAWDSDVDVLINSEAVERLVKYIPIHFSKDVKMDIHVDWKKPRNKRRRHGRFKGWAYTEPIGRLYFFPEARHIDLFQFFYNTKTDDKVVVEFGTVRKYDKEIIFPLRDCEYLTIPSKCVNQPETVLKLQYGVDWSTPSHRCVNGEWERVQLEGRPKVHIEHGRKVD